MFDQEKFFGMGQQCTTHQIENYLRPTPTLLFHMSSHKKADHTKGDDKWAGAKVILSLNYGLWPFSSAYFHTDVPKREISTHSFQFIRIQGVFKKMCWVYISESSFISWIFLTVWNVCSDQFFKSNISWH